MRRLCLLLILPLSLLACAERGAIAFGSPVDGGTIHDVWTVNFRPTEAPAEGQRSPPRPESPRFERYSVSVPPSHRPGRIEWPEGTPRGAQDFLTVSADSFSGADRFANAVACGDSARTNTTLLYVHGYNYTHGEAVYQAAQIAHDFEVPSPLVLFSWPSAGTPVGYLYDRDSVLIARDQLEQAIVALTRTPGRKLEILAHSMGAFLVMETLRQIEISRSVDITAKIDALIMVSPDIDGELFYRQASRLKTLPQETVILAARQDRALRISALLTGRTNRLGSETDRDAVRDLPIVVVDTSDLVEGRQSHSVPFTSPAAIAIINDLERNPERFPTNRVENSVVNLAGFR